MSSRPPGVRHCTDETSLVNAGRAGPEQPKRFYKFALIDPTDQPFATFRYYYRTWEQINQLDLLKDGVGEPGDDTDMSVIEPYEGPDMVPQEPEGSEGVIEGEPGDVFGPSDEGTTDFQPRAYVPSGAPGSRTSGRYSIEQALAECHSGGVTLPQFYRLSIPPSCRLYPPAPSSRPLPSLPRKNDTSPRETSYRPHPAYPVDEWAIRTPSPVKSIRDGISTPPLGKRRGFTPTSLMNAIATTWKRRGTPSSELTSDSGSRNAPRSVSRGDG